MSNSYYSPAQAEARLGLSLDDIIATERSATAAAAKKKAAKAAPAKQQLAKAPPAKAKRAHAAPAATNNKSNRDRAAPYPKRDRDRDYPPERSHRGGGGGDRNHGRNDYDDDSDVYDDHRESWRERTGSAAYRKSFDQPPAPAAPPQPIQFTIVNDRLPSQQSKKNSKPKPKGKGKSATSNEDDVDAVSASNAPRREQSAGTDGSAPPPTTKKQWNKKGKRGAAAVQQASTTPSTSTASPAPAPTPTPVVAPGHVVAAAPAPAPGGVFPGGATTVIMAGAAPPGFHATPGYPPHQQVQYITPASAPVQYFAGAPSVQYVTYPGAAAAPPPLHVMPQGATIAYAMPPGYPHPM
ncbi:hypothetical protein AMAG_10800 [Allomyces macrogynus ATCC 38327]|uniref:Uncharacterized protein n=1 Tax=Allomyces macrogynus (strain ATCC 38327) TaxID=578462 RepID=A0A0L0SRJ5_ALLM3|nr:hypothetical protein AMAG_10800 [Allomyces macrogynus ATCC 38327]|eukprot:KNE65147.1 hypothetical protein AMAG_10800 [Allomyces macrogynus ATCC 38327]